MMLHTYGHRRQDRVILLGICLKHKISGGASLLNKFVARLAILTS